MTQRELLFYTLFDYHNAGGHSRMLPGLTLQAVVLTNLCNIRKKMKGLVSGIEVVELAPQRGCPGLEERAPLGYDVVVDFGKALGYCWPLNLVIVRKTNL